MCAASPPLVVVPVPEGDASILLDHEPMATLIARATWQKGEK
jgi:hypothetical protein